MDSEKKMKECICAFDIGYKNFAYSILEIDRGCIKKEEWDVKHEWWKCAEMDCIDFTIGEGGDIFKKMHECLYDIFVQNRKNDSVMNWTILIEKQLGFNSIVNYKAIQIASHLYAFFLLKFPGIKIYEYPSCLKTRVFGMKIQNKKDRKKWAVEKVLECFSKQKDEIATEWLDCFKKKDDICDCILMVLTYVIRTQFLNKN